MQLIRHSRRLIISTLLLIVPLCSKADLAIETADLYLSCLSVCAAVDSEPLPIEELSSPDACVAYLKGLSSIIIGTTSRPAQMIGAESCASNFSKNRSAKSPAQDGVLIRACAFGRWAAANKSTLKKPALDSVLLWMRSGNCEEI